MMIAEYAIAGALGLLALYAMSTTAKLPKSAASQVSQSSSSSQQSKSKSKSSSRQSKSTADSAPVVTSVLDDGSINEIAGEDDDKTQFLQEGGVPKDYDNNSDPKSDDTPAASLPTQPDTEKPKNTKSSKDTVASAKKAVASTKKAVGDAYRGKGQLPAMKQREDPSPEAEDKDEYKAEGGDSKSPDFIGK
jgi:hypothetical protein